MRNLNKKKKLCHFQEWGRAEGERKGERMGYLMRNGRKSGWEADEKWEERKGSNDIKIY